MTLRTVILKLETRPKMRLKNNFVVILFLFHIFQSLHSGCDNDPIDLEGLHESVVDSDEDLADSMDVSFKILKKSKLLVTPSLVFQSS
jgi:hypothetical protein